MHRTDSNMRGSRKFSRWWSKFRPGSVGRTKLYHFKTHIVENLGVQTPAPTSLSAHEQELHRVDAEPTIENMFNNRLCDECGPKNGDKILPFVTDFVWDF